ALVHLCLEQAIAGLGEALLANERYDRGTRSKGLTRALTAITALEMGIDRSVTLAEALLQIYESARKAILDSVVNFDPGTLASIRDDLQEIAAVLRPAGSTRPSHGFYPMACPRE